jgi:hypothetical protein
MGAMNGKKRMEKGRKEEALALQQESAADEDDGIGIGIGWGCLVDWNIKRGKRIWRGSLFSAEAISGEVGQRERGKSAQRMAKKHYQKWLYKGKKNILKKIG